MRIFFVPPKKKYMTDYSFYYSFWDWDYWSIKEWDYCSLVDWCNDYCSISESDFFFSRMRLLLFRMTTENVVLYHNGDWECCCLSEWWVKTLILRMVTLNVVIYQNGDWECCCASEWWLKMLLCIRMVTELLVFFNRFS